MAIALMNTWVNCKLHKTNSLYVLRKLERRASTNQLHRDLSLLKVYGIDAISLLCFMNNCTTARCPKTFCNFYQVRQTERELRNDEYLGVPWARTEIGLSSCYIKGARLWDEHFEAVNSHAYKICFEAKVTKYFIDKYVWYLHKTSLRPDGRCNELF